MEIKKNCKQTNAYILFFFIFIASSIFWLVLLLSLSKQKQFSGCFVPCSHGGPFNNTCLQPYSVLSELTLLPPFVNRA